MRWDLKRVRDELLFKEDSSKERPRSILHSHPVLCPELRRIIDKFEAPKEPKKTVPQSSEPIEYIIISDDDDDENVPLKDKHDEHKESNQLFL